MKGGMGSGTAAPDGPCSLHRVLVRPGSALSEAKGGREGTQEGLSTSERCGGRWVGI